MECTCCEVCDTSSILERGQLSVAPLAISIGKSSDLTKSAMRTKNSDGMQTRNELAAGGHSGHESARVCTSLFARRPSLRPFDCQRRRHRLSAVDSALALHASLA